MTSPRSTLLHNLPPDCQQGLLTVARTAQVLALSERSVRGLIAEGSLPVIRVGARAVRVLPEDLAGFIEERRA